MAKTKTAEKRQKAKVKPGSKIAQMLDYLKNEMVGDELLFGQEHAKNLMEKLHVRKEQVWNMLQALDKKNLIRRKKEKGTKGFTVMFPTPSEPSNSETPITTVRRRHSARVANTDKSNTGLTLDALISGLQTEVDGIEENMKTLRQQLENLDEQFKSRSRVLSQLREARAELTRGQHG